MKREPTKDQNIEAILGRLNRHLTVDHGKQVSFGMFELESAKTALCSIFEFRRGFPGFLKLNTVSKALFETGKAGKLDLMRFRQAVNKGQSDYFKKEEKHFRVIYRVALKPGHDIGTFRFKHCTISFRNSKINYDLEEIDEARKKLQIPRLSASTQISVSVKARCKDSAEELASHYLNLLLGMMNFSLTYNRTTYNFGGYRVVSRIRLDPVHSVHSLDGKMEENGIYYRIHVDEDVLIFDAIGKENSICKNVNKMRKLIYNHPYKERMEEVLLKYSAIFESSDPSVVFGDLWSLLEKLTGAYKQYECVRRASFRYSERDFHKAILSHLRELRNTITHDSIGIGQQWYSIHQLKAYVDNLIITHLFWGRKFGDFNSAIRVLDSDMSLKELKIAADLLSR
ncbi:MAG: hypothetical protein WC326_12435 [Candidatus Delongbacteria bacterium]